MKHFEQILEAKGVRVTANRLLVVQALHDQKSPSSLSELEQTLFPMDKSSIFRVLCHFVDNHVVHSIEDGAGMIRYELCSGHDDCSVDDMHVHFYCEVCKHSECFHDVPIPKVDVPEGYEVNSITYMIKGICPKCRNKR